MRGASMSELDAQWKAFAEKFHPRLAKLTFTDDGAPPATLSQLIKKFCEVGSSGDDQRTAQLLGTMKNLARSSSSS